MLRISFSNISSSIKFSAFIASGILFFISLAQIITSGTLFWEIVGVLSGFVFIFLLVFALINALKPVFVALKERRKLRRKLKKKGFFEAVRGLFTVNCYFKVMAIIWFMIILIGLEIAIHYISLVESPEKYQTLANFGFMIVTISTALFILNVSRLFRK